MACWKTKQLLSSFFTMPVLWVEFCLMLNFPEEYSSLTWLLQLHFSTEGMETIWLICCILFWTKLQYILKDKNPWKLAKMVIQNAKTGVIYVCRITVHYDHKFKNWMTICPFRPPPSPSFPLSPTSCTHLQNSSLFSNTPTNSL